MVGTYSALEKGGVAGRWGKVYNAKRTGRTENKEHPKYHPSGGELCVRPLFHVIIEVSVDGYE